MLNVIQSRAARRACAAFTMIEIAICLAIISFALLAIIGVLPIGMNAQRDNREETLITQDATMLINAIRTGARGMDDLTNYVYAIVNANLPPANQVGYTNELAGKMGFSINSFPSVPVGNWHLELTNGAKIVGLLSTPGITNYARVRAISGLASQKPPQYNSTLLADGFGYQLVCMGTPVPMVNPGIGYGWFGHQLTNCQSELRLRFLWPVLPNGAYGSGRQTFRATIAGQLIPINVGATKLYFYQTQSFTNAPYLP